MGSQGHVAVVTTLLSGGRVGVEEFNIPGGYGLDHISVFASTAPSAYLHRT
jgi:hypothetical protein